MPIWVADSIQPGVTILPVASMTRAPAGTATFAPTAAILPPRITTVPRSIGGTGHRQHARVGDCDGAVGPGARATPWRRGRRSEAAARRASRLTAAARHAESSRRGTAISMHAFIAHLPPESGRSRSRGAAASLGSVRSYISAPSMNTRSARL